jgi:hypothetical protein
MTPHPHDEIEAFALGSLDEMSGRRVLEHADQCPTCAVLLADALNTVHKMEPGGERAIQGKIRLPDLLPPKSAFASSPARRPWWLLQVATAAAVVAIIVQSINLNHEMHASSFTVPIAALVHSHFTHHALHGDGGNVKVIQDLNGRWLYLIADGLMPKARYDLFETVHGQPREVGQFVSTASGEATAYWEQAPARIERLQVVSVGTPSTMLRWP